MRWSNTARTHATGWILPILLVVGTTGAPADAAQEPGFGAPLSAAASTFTQDPSDGRVPVDLPCQPDRPAIQLVHAVPAGSDGTPTAQAQALLREGARWMNGDVLAGARRAGGGDRQLRFAMTAACEVDVLTITFSAEPGVLPAVLAIRDVLQAQGEGRSDRLYLAWADGHPAGEDESCGLANRIHDDRPAPDGTAGSGMLYGVLLDGCHDATDSPGPLHELFHMLGAAQESAPHFSDRGHVSDGADLMNPAAEDGTTCTGPADSFLPDCGADDYFNPAPEPGSYLATHWNTADSVFLVTDAAGPTVPLVPPAIRFDDPTPASRAATVSTFRMGDDDRPGRVLLARDDEVADALAASTLMDDAVLLYTGRDVLDEATASELQRLVDRQQTFDDPTLPVTILGGAAAISDAVAQAVLDLDPAIEVRRLSGPTRIQTALAVADAALEDGYATPGTMAIARAAGTPDNPTAGWADAIGAGGLLADEHVPLLLTATEALHPDVAEWLRTHDVETTIVLGGTAAISDAVADQLPGTVVRLAGDGRDGTAAAVNRGWADRGTDIMIAFNGYVPDGWVDGLIAAGLATDSLATMLLVARDAVPPATASLAADTCGELWVVGTNDAISAVVADDLAC